MQPISPRFLSLLLIIGFALPRLTGQTFEPLPTTQSQEVAFNQANEVYIHFSNPSGDTLHLKWRQLEISMPENWDIDLCDYGTCYIGIPPNGTMNPVFDTIQPYLKLIVQPGATPGAAWCWFRVQEVDNATNFADVYFSLYTPGITADHAPDQSAIRVFPNPAQDMLVIENPGFESIPARLFDLTGRMVWQGNLPSSTQTRISLQTFADGLYFLQMHNESRQIAVKH